ncbi:MAG: hypothetical protein BGO49_26025 [Planctomycetales bacterium 71-10]|nr:MAG: hypothetical protein BGO49_26025 [Planctomycetales bacterium 71-10]
MRCTLAHLRRLAILAAFAPAPSLRADEAGGLKPMAAGPVHEAFLSPRRDVEPPVVPKSPPPPVVERPAAEPPSSEARWIEGYWDWLAESGKFAWVTGTWRVPPPGRFWVNGLWKRDADGWRRTPGFWSDRSTDRIAYRKDGPPDRRPPDDPGAPPKPNCFYIPGQYVPDGDGLAWRKGFWADAKPGWAWVPASWTRQPEGWIYQAGYWDRPLEERGTLFAPAELAGEVADGQVLAYRPYTEVSPQLYGQLYGAFGRWTPWYDGYPGVCYDPAGRYFAYADYGRLAPFYGYLDYPALGGFGYPYYASPIAYAAPGALAYGLGPPYYGFGNSLLPLMTGYPLFGGLGLVGGGWGWGWPGWNPGAYAWGIPGWSGVALGTWPGFGWGTWGWSGPAIGAWPGFQNVGFPNWFSGWGGWGWGGFGWGGWGWNGLGWGGWGFPGIIWGGNPVWAGCYPFENSGRRDPVAPPHRVDRPGGTVGEHLAAHGAMRQGPTGLRGEGVSAPPATRPFAALEDRPALVGMRSAAPDGVRMGAMRGEADRPATWLHSYNGVAPAMRQEHQAARPAFANHAAGSDVVNVPGVGPMIREGSPGAADGPGFGRMRQATPDARAALAEFPSLNGTQGPFMPQIGPGNFPSPRGAETLINPNAAWQGGMRRNDADARQALSPSFAPQLPGGPGIDLGPMRAAGALQPGFEGRMRAPGFDPSPGLGNGFSGGFRQPGGFANSGNFGAGVYNGGSPFSGGMRSADPGAGPGGMGFGGMRGGGDLGGGFGGMRGGGDLGGGMRGGGAAGGFGGAAGGAGGGNFGGHMR